MVDLHLILYYIAFGNMKLTHAIDFSNTMSKISVELLLLFRRYTRYSIAYDETSWGGGIGGMQKNEK